jgi:hypothetical protein
MGRREVLAALPVGGVGVEVGVWEGAFSAQLLRVARPARLYLVDPWAFDKNNPRAWYGGKKALDQRDMDLVYKGVHDRFAEDERVRLLRMTSDKAYEVILELDRLDWAYIDGDHSYEAVRRDIELYRGLLKPGGILAGDDYNNSGWWGDGVRRAVDESLPDVAISGSQFIWRKPRRRKDDA